MRIEINPKDCHELLTSSNIYWKWRDSILLKNWKTEIKEHRQKIQAMSRNKP